MADKLLTTSQAAKMLGVSVATTRRWDSEGLLKAQKMVDKVSQALRECEDAPPEPKGEA
jgi:excisionase family DNA binding protein